MADWQPIPMCYDETLDDVQRRVDLSSRHAFGPPQQDQHVDDWWEWRLRGVGDALESLAIERWNKIHLE